MNYEKIMAELIREGATVTKQRIEEARAKDRPSWERDLAKQQAQAKGAKFIECLFITRPEIEEVEEDDRPEFSLASFLLGMIVMAGLGAVIYTICSTL